MCGHRLGAASEGRLEPPVVGVGEDLTRRGRRDAGADAGVVAGADPDGRRGSGRSGRRRREAVREQLELGRGAPDPDVVLPRHDGDLVEVRGDGLHLRGDLGERPLRRRQRSDRVTAHRRAVGEQPVVPPDHGADRAQDRALQEPLRPAADLGRLVSRRDDLGVVEPEAVLELLERGDQLGGRGRLLVGVGPFAGWVNIVRNRGQRVAAERVAAERVAFSPASGVAGGPSFGFRHGTRLDNSALARARVVGAGRPPVRESRRRG